VRDHPTARAILTALMVVAVGALAAACGGDGGVTAPTGSAASSPSTAPSPSPSSSRGTVARVAAGSFVPVAHEAQGTAEIWRTAEGGYELRLRGFSVDSGPDLFVWLVDDPLPDSNAAVEEATHLDAGALKGSGGDQTYSLPSDLDPNDYHAVVIWCKRFAENFAYAPLSGDVDSQAD
jgi:hypothetical protein